MYSHYMLSFFQSFHDSMNLSWQPWLCDALDGICDEAIRQLWNTRRQALRNLSTIKLYMEPMRIAQSNRELQT